MNESTVDRDPFERLAEEFAERLRRGEHPSITEYVARYPEHAADIRELFPEIALVEHYKPAEHDVAISSPPPVRSPRGEIPDQLGDYRILRYLGEGGMGIVYEAVRESLRCHVALKVMHRRFRNREEYLRRFRTEARSAARLHHTNIVGVFDYGVHESVCYYAMQYIAGQSLDKVLGDVRQLRQENEASPAALTVKLASGQGGPTGLDPRDIARGAGSRLDPLRQTVTMGLLTGQWSAAPLSDGSRDGENPPLPAASDAIEDGAQIECWAAKLAGDMCTTVGDQIERGVTAPRALGPEPPPDSGDVGGRGSVRADSEPPALSGSTSTLTGKADARYYREVARLGAQVADALAYAHGRSVFHRDIKPPNLLLDPLGNIWITDFGLAKFQDGDDVSQSQDAFGTLSYMAPERFRGVTTAQCDLYALGATLYEMLTLRPPFEGQDQLQLINRIQNDPPLPPRQLERGIPPDLETIVLKALAKSPSDRFESAEEMAAELRRFVEGRPIHSRPIPPYQKFGRWCKRNPGLATASIAAALLTTVLALVSTVAAVKLRVQLDQIQKSETRAREARTEARERLFVALTDRARAGRFSHRIGQRFETLAAVTEATKIAKELGLPPARLDPLRDEAIACMALPDLEQTGRVITQPPNVLAIAFDPTMTRYALGFNNRTTQVRRVADDHEVARFRGPVVREIYLFLFSPDGRYLATSDSPGDSLTVWDVDRRVVSLSDRGPLSQSRAARFSPDSRQLALVRANGEVMIYELASGQPRRRWRGPGPAQDLAFRADGSQIAILYRETAPTCRILEAETGRLVRSISLPAAGECVAWSFDSETLAIPCFDRNIYLWDDATGMPKAILKGHTNGGLSAAFHPAGNLLASNGWDGRLWLWDPVLGRPWFNISGRSETVCHFSHDGRVVIAPENQWTTYKVEPAREYRTLGHLASQPIEFATPSVHRDGRVLAVGTSLGVGLWDLARGTELAFLPIGPTMHLLFQPSGDLLTSGPAGVTRWPVRLNADRSEFRIGPPSRLRLPASAEEMAADRSGRIVALAYRDRAFVATPERIFSVGPLDDCRYVAVSPDGQWLATGTHGKTGVQVWNVRDAIQVAHPLTNGFGRVRFSPDGKWLMNRAAPCRLWEVGTWREARQLDGYGQCFSADGRLLVVQDASKILRLLETETGRTLAQFDSPGQDSVNSASFSPDGSRLVVSTNDGPAAHVWDLRAIRRRLAQLGLDWDAPSYPDTDSLSENGPPPGLQFVIDWSALSSEPIPLLQAALRLEQAGKIGEAIGMLRRAVDVSPNLAEIRNNLAWLLVTAPGPLRNPGEALEHARRAVELAPGQGIYLNTLGVAEYRAGRYAEAIATLERSLAVNGGQFEGFDLLFLAMSHHRRGHRDEARNYFHRAVTWLKGPKNLSAQQAQELADFRSEAEEVLARPVGDFPDAVFAEPR
jgi:serine/threonine protein kinase/WD40 repeat protein